MPSSVQRLKKQTTIYLIEQRAFFIYFFLHSIFFFCNKLLYSFLLCSLQSSLENKKTTWRETDDFYVVLGHIFIIKLKKKLQRIVQFEELQRYSYFRLHGY
jgi:hypothetical protein